MIPANRKYALWILAFVAASLTTVLFLGHAGINVGKLLSVIASLLFYAIPIAIVVYVISLAKRYVDCKVMESKNGCRDGCKDRTAEAGNQADQGHRWMKLLKIVVAVLINDRLRITGAICYCSVCAARDLLLPAIHCRIGTR
jgi:hypothetical protein